MEAAMEVMQTGQPPSCSSPADTYPRWVLLEPYATITNVQDDSSCHVTGDAKTLAAATTSTGHRIHVSLVGLAEPPVTSSLHFELLPVGDVGIRSKYARIVAAHGDSLLIEVHVEQGLQQEYEQCLRTVDLFVYSAGAAADPTRRLPTLSLLPVVPADPMQPYYEANGAGILRHGEDEFIVAELHMEVGMSNCGMPETNAAGKLDMFRSSGQWDVRHVGIWSSKTKDGEVQEMPTRWNVYNVVVFPVGDRTLCWAELSCGIIFCDVLEDSPLLQYIPLPAVPCFGNPSSHRNVGATADGTLKFVNIFPRCCCGGAGVSSCQHSKSAYTIQTWTLRMDDMEWVMDAMVDATELWVLETYNGLPRVLLDYPIMSIDEPHVISFMLCEGHHVKHGGGDRTLWLVMVDTRSKTIQSVSRHPRVEWFHGDDLMIPSSVSYYFNCHPMPKSEGQISHLMDIEKQKDDDSWNSMMRSSYKSSVEPFVQLSEILAALQEIPNYGLCRDDMLKAYSILSHGDGQQFRSLLGLPSTLRKDWFLMEIKKGW